LQERHPAVIIPNNQQNQFSTILTVLPITSRLDRIYPFEILTNINDKKGKILLDQITTIDKEFVKQKITSLTDKELIEVERKLHLTLALSCYHKVKK
jgi:mRNA interferase MazF